MVLHITETLTLLLPSHTVTDNTTYPIHGHFYERDRSFPINVIGLRSMPDVVG